MIRKAIIIILALAGCVWASGPQFGGYDANTALEFQNVYNDLRSPKMGNASASTFTVTSLTATGISVSTITASSATIANLTVTNLIAQVPPDTNLLVNGGFEIWQRLTSYSAGNSGVYTADRWRTSVNSGPGFTVSRETTNIDSGTRSLKLVIHSISASTTLQLNQLIERYQDLRGKTISVTARVASTSTKFRLIVDDGVTTAYSNPNSGSNSFETMTLTTPISASASSVYIGFGFQGTSFGPVVSTSTIDSMYAVVGSTVPNFVEEDPEIMLARCYRYYEKSYDPDDIPATVTTAGEIFTPLVQSDSTNYVGTVWFKVAKRGTPTITLYRSSDGTSGSWQARNTSGSDANATSSAIFVTRGTFRVNNQTNSSPTLHGHYTADAEM